jgi:hypothetical protein
MSVHQETSSDRRWRRAALSALVVAPAVFLLSACGGAAPSPPAKPTVQAAATQAVSAASTAVTTAQAAASPIAATAQAAASPAATSAAGVVSSAVSAVGTAVASPSPSPSPEAHLPSQTSERISDTIDAADRAAANSLP